jgi:hypothetical protein
MKHKRSIARQTSNKLKSHSESSISSQSEPISSKFNSKLVHRIIKPFSIVLIDLKHLTSIKQASLFKTQHIPPSTIRRLTQLEVAYRTNQPTQTGSEQYKFDVKSYILSKQSMLLDDRVENRERIEYLRAKLNPDNKFLSIETLKHIYSSVTDSTDELLRMDRLMDEMDN